MDALLPVKCRVGLGFEGVGSLLPVTVCFSPEHRGSYHYPMLELAPLLYPAQNGLQIERLYR